MRYYRETSSADISPHHASHPDAAIRSYQAIAAILTERDGTPVTTESVGKRCTAAERRLAAALRNDPLIRRWLRRQGIEVAADLNRDESSGERSGERASTLSNERESRASNSRRQQELSATLSDQFSARSS